MLFSFLDYINNNNSDNNNNNIFFSLKVVQTHANNLKSNNTLEILLTNKQIKKIFNLFIY